MISDESFLSVDIESFLTHFIKLTKKHNNYIYFHNLKFDGQFILSYLLENDIEFTTLIVARSNAYYQIVIPVNKKKLIIELSLNAHVGMHLFSNLYF